MKREELIMRIYDEQAAQARHHESLRVNFVSILLTFGSIIFAIIGYDGAITRHDAPVLIFLFFIGLFGCLASMKHYERNRMHVARARKMREMAEETLAIGDVGAALYEARNSHQKDYPFLSRKVRVKYVWALAPLLLSIASAVLLITAETWR